MICKPSLLDVIHSLRTDSSVSSHRWEDGSFLRIPLLILSTPLSTAHLEVLDPFNVRLGPILEAKVTSFSITRGTYRIGFTIIVGNAFP